MELNIPYSVAIIMDGNGRWAQSRGLDRVDGHVKGVESVRSAIKAAQHYGVKVLTLYAFSTENWGRPEPEVQALMELFGRCIAQETPEMVKEGIKIRFVGDRSRFTPELQKAIDNSEKKSEECDVMTLQLALNYSSHDEIRRAVVKIAQRVERNQLKSDEITEEVIARELDTLYGADPDLMIRTSGEMRLSNFMLWQAAYTELYVTDVLWPDFDREQFAKAIEAYSQRDRRFGRVTANKGGTK